MSFRVIHTDSMKSCEVFDEKELSQMVFNSIEYYKNRADRIAKDNKDLREKGLEMAEEGLKNQITRLEERLKMSYGEFASQKEKDRYEDFTKRHMHDRATSRANGGKCPYLIPTGTGIGTILHVKCPICGEEEDITDGDVW